MPEAHSCQLFISIFRTVEGDLHILQEQLVSSED